MIGLPPAAASQTLGPSIHFPSLLIATSPGSPKKSHPFLFFTSRVSIRSITNGMNGPTIIISNFHQPLRVFGSTFIFSSSRTSTHWSGPGPSPTNKQTIISSSSQYEVKGRGGEIEEEK
jgi:hypothetical protein